MKAYMSPKFRQMIEDRNTASDIKIAYRNSVVSGVPQEVSVKGNLTIVVSDKPTAIIHNSPGADSDS